MNNDKISAIIGIIGFTTMMYLIFTYPNHKKKPVWIIWLLSRMAFSVAVITAAFLAFVSAFFVIGAFASLLEWALPMAVIGLAIASGCMFLTMLCKSCASWIHNKYF